MFSFAEALLVDFFYFFARRGSGCIGHLFALTAFQNGRTDVNDPATVDSILVRVSRLAETELYLWDFKISSASIYQIPGGDIGFAAGVEARRETFAEDRDGELFVVGYSGALYRVVPAAP